MNRLTVVGEAKAELTVERSRFLAWAAGVADEAQAIEFIAAASPKVLRRDAQPATLFRRDRSKDFRMTESRRALRADLYSM